MADYISRSQINMLMAALRGCIPSEELVVDERIKGNLYIALPLRFSIKSSGFYFQITYSESTYWVQFFPSKPPKGVETRSCYKFPAVVSEIKYWAERISVELNEPDPWSILGYGKLPEPELIDRREENQKFSDHELSTIKDTIREIRRFLVMEISPNPKYLKSIDERLNFLEEEAKKQNKKQWVYVAVGVVATIVDGLAMSPEQTHKLFDLLTGLFKNLFMKLLA